MRTQQTNFDRKRQQVERAYKAAGTRPAPSWLRYVRDRACMLARVAVELALIRIAEQE